MLLTRVILKDYGAYRGRNEFDLSCTSERPIVLIGGANGAGKTTLFESIMLCLYGMSSTGRRTSRKAYGELLAGRIHRYGGSDAAADSASVTVEFRFFHDGKETEFQVERSWRNEEGRISEGFAVRKRSADNSFAPLDMMEEAHWQSLIREMIPRGVAGLFFFDGEKVAKIAELGNEDMVIKNSFSSLLGLDIVEQLRSDLQTNLMRNLASNDAPLQKEIEGYEREKADAMELVDRLRDKVATREAELDRTRADIEGLEDRISGLGGDFATKRKESRERLASYTATHEGIAKQIREMCSSVLPFTLVPGQLHGLREQILQDAKMQEQRIGKKMTGARLEEVRSRMGSESFWEEFDVPGGTRERIRDKVLSSLGSGAGPADIVGSGVFDFSTTQAAGILGLIDRAGAATVSKLEESTAGFVDMGEKIARMQISLASAPADDEIGPIVSRLSELKISLGGLQAELEHMQSEISSGEALIRHTTVKMRDAVSKRYKNAGAKIRVDLTEKVQVVLDEYAAKLRARKLTLLERYIVDAIAVLMHKSGFIEKVSIDRETFRIELFRRDGEPIPRRILSTGEKQMLATAILWALAKTSGKPLPFVIDTPLARLDEAHRDNMVEKFFPLASHQVLVFSTDTEVDLEYYRKLEPYLARSYVMEFAHEGRMTRLLPGYFWNEEGRKVVAAR